MATQNKTSDGPRGIWEQNAIPDAVCDGFHVVPVRSSTEVTHFATGQQHGELLAGGAARGIQPNAICLYEDLDQAARAGGPGRVELFENWRLRHKGESCHVDADV